VTELTQGAQLECDGGKQKGRREGGHYPSTAKSQVGSYHLKLCSLSSVISPVLIYLEQCGEPVGEVSPDCVGNHMNHRIIAS